MIDSVAPPRLRSEPAFVSEANTARIRFEMLNQFAIFAGLKPDNTKCLFRNLKEVKQLSF